MIRIKLLFLTLLFPFLTFSQTNGLRLGALLGAGESRFKNSSLSNPKGRFAFSGGLAMNYQFFKNFGLYGNVLFTSKGAKASGTERGPGILPKYYTYNQRFTIYSIDIPVMPKVSIGIGDFFIKAFAGPSINFNFLGKEEKQYDDMNYDESYGYANRDIQNLNVIEYSFVVGGGFDVKIANDDILYLEARYSSGINNFGQINSTDAFSRYFMIGIGYLYKR